MRSPLRSHFWMVLLTGAALLLVLVSFHQLAKTDFVTRLSDGPVIGRFGPFGRRLIALRHALQVPSMRRPIRVKSFHSL